MISARNRLDTIVHDLPLLMVQRTIAVFIKIRIEYSVGNVSNSVVRYLSFLREYQHLFARSILFYLLIRFDVGTILKNCPSNCTKLPY